MTCNLQPRRPTHRSLVDHRSRRKPTFRTVVMVDGIHHQLQLLRKVHQVSTLNFISTISDNKEYRYELTKYHTI